MQLERGFALFRANGQLARRNADILCVRFVVVARRGSQILDVFAENIADHTILINLCPCIVEFNDIDEFACRHTAQLLRGRGFFRSYRHVLGNGSRIKDILSQCLRDHKHQRKEYPCDALFHASILNILILTPDVKKRAARETLPPHQPFCTALYVALTLRRCRRRLLQRPCGGSSGKDAPLPYQRRPHQRR